MLHAEAALQIVVVQIVQESAVYRRRNKRLLVLGQGQGL